jgi:hypothetical protein
VSLVAAVGNDSHTHGDATINGLDASTISTGTLSRPTSSSSASCTGNAATATRLATARTIGGVSFNGTANINLPGVNASGNQNTAGNAATATSASNVVTTKTSTNANHQIGFYSYSSEISQPCYIDNTGSLAFNPSTNLLTAGNLNTATAIVTSAVNATSKDTGALIITNGGIGVELNVHVGGNVTEDSDRRIKENLEVIPNALEKITKINGYNFDRSDIELRQSGVIAQEVIEVLPEVVTTSENGMMAVAYGHMAGLFVEAIKELKEQVDTQQQEIENLKNKMTIE